ncbi:Eco57I restriction-modification methylase domain-containing protein [Kovacikia minuta CCNUW1]|nr:TaqI-like C-terminal specificity domain-containing protein [Kovacikia minuta]UBF28257.1 Eco57I restriction-modification methylase domain-containing protein [Kovacikia minuta CCNUW1]
MTGRADTFDFRIYFSEVFRKNHGFDVVIGNPPYVRQEQIKHLKDQLEKRYECYTGTADLYIFFYERGLNLLREHGVLTYISSNKWFRAAYGKKLRQFITRETQLQQIIDFGDAPVFAAIAYPTIVITQKGKPETQTFHALNWEMGQSISQFETVVQSQSFTMPQQVLTAEGWQFADTTALNLLEKLRQAGTPLGEYVQNRFYYGIKTGFNEAFVVDRPTRDRLIAEHPSSAEVLKPFLRGRDVKRWSVDYADLYLIKIESSENKQHPWTGKAKSEAEQVFAQTYPAIHNRFSQAELRETLIKRSDQGRFFWELRSCVYWQEFERSKIIYPDIYEHQSFAVDINNFFSGNTCYFIPTNELWLCGLLNSKIIEWFYRNISNSVRGGYLRAFSNYIKQIPIPPASDRDKAEIQALVGYVLYLTAQLKDIPSYGENLMTVADDKLMLSYFEQIIDAVVMELYLPNELHTHDKYFMRHLLQENLPSLDKIKNDKMPTLRSIFQRLFDREHPIREGIFFLDSVPIVRTIRGLKRESPKSHSNISEPSMQSMRST